MEKNIDNLAISAIRATCIDTINKANSGHPGMALGSAPILYTLFKNHMVANPKNSNWFNRDRFVLSSGHASALLYTMLHLCGYKLSIDDLKSFRQLGSLTPGHPEYKHTEGIDATSGPLGQGIAQAVGMALAEKAIASQYSEGNKICNHYTYVLCGDGCLEEGLSQEAISFAGLQKLNKLILFYDSNKITLDGSLDLSFNENVKGRFIASNWDVIEVNDGNNIAEIDDAIIKAKQSKEKPTIIIVHTIIGFGSAKQGTNKVHGNPLGEEDGKHAKEIYGYNYPSFEIPTEVYGVFKDTFIKRGVEANAKWDEDVKLYSKSHNDEFKLFNHALEGDIEHFVDFDKTFDPSTNESTRVSSGKILNEFYNKIPFLMGGSADVAGSVMTKIENGVSFSPSSCNGRNINFGIREFAMASIQNGMLLHKGLKTYVGSFLVFADYMKSAVRMSSLSKLPAIYLYSHDSIAVGEDGPTHQPIETLAMLRSIPNFNVIRPCDVRETYAAWLIALKSKETPTALILSRQNLPIVNSSVDGVFKGAYVVNKAKNKEDIILLATGSEVSLALQVQKLLLEKGIDSKVVSMPSMYLFEKQSESYKKDVLSLPKNKIVSIEMLSTFGWHKYSDYPYGINSFGTSAPAKEAIKAFHFLPEDIVDFICKNVK